ncbi:penicillin-binding protein 2 [Pyramidobacter sp. C12-8]|uniref:penicillin-binding protein 2 n=1 Tax=Pyramidobacter sp. C12-8 TaxID=1943580 RepID=UPI00098F0B1E|nr:penicillin-binding protein 2 [Pyramidobacter sp. C12-8]OON89248.1 penicillin-binding protein 2 [Pyramidobacter sp. C12-8]
MTKNLSEQPTQRLLSDTRLNFWRAVVAGSFVVLAIALALFQVLWSDRYVGLALKNRLRLIRMPPARGQIYDRKGLPLALNVMTFDIMGYPLDLQRDEVKQKLLGALQRARLPHDPEKLEQRVKNLYWAPYRAISLVSNLTLLQMTSLMEDPEFPEVLFPLPVWRRTYPAGPLASHVVGYVGEISEQELRSVETDENKSYIGGDVIGKSGVEKYYEDVLRGSIGERAVEVDARGRQRRTLNETMPGIGQDLTLTIDLSAQSYASDLMKDYNGVMVALDVNNGEVIVMWSNPSYDPNPLAWGVSGTEWAGLNLDSSRPLLNRAISGQYSPGSIFKAVTGYAALESGVVDKNTSVHCSGVFRLGGNLYHCWRRGGHGRETFVRALRDSCDVYFYETSQMVGVKRYDDVGERFALGRPLGIDLPGEAAGILPGPEWKKKTMRQSWFKGDSVNMSIGQGFVLLTPLQMASVYATIANGGVFYRPHVLKTAEVEGQPTGLRPEYLQLVKAGLRAVVAKGGTGHRAAVSGVEIAGKTGTVQHDHGKDHAVFAGYAPASKPRYAVVCFIEGGESGGRVAGPLVGQLLSFLLNENGSAKEK